MSSKTSFDQSVCVVLLAMFLVTCCRSESTAAEPQNRVPGAAAQPQNPIQPHEVKAICEHAGMIWFALVSVCVFGICVCCHGRKAIRRAPKCAVIAVLGSAVIVIGFVRSDPWLQAIGASILIVAHICECTAIGLHHIAIELNTAKQVNSSASGTCQKDSEEPEPEYSGDEVAI